MESKVEIFDEMVDVTVIKNALRASATDLILEVSIEEQEWSTSIIQKLTHPSSLGSQED